MQVLPADCRLDRPTKEVVYETLLENEVPCYGCPKAEGCEARLDGGFETAAVLMGEDAAELARTEGVVAVCPRCGSTDSIAWAAEVTAVDLPHGSDRAGKRAWKCHGRTMGSRRQCNWSRVEYAGKARA